MALTREEIVAAIERAGVVAVIRMKDPARLESVAAALMEGGVTAMEITMTVPGAVDLIRALAPRMPPGFLLGAGTVIDPDTTAKVIDAGAQFIVSPVFRPDVVARCRQSNVPALPGCFSPTEILAAWDAGADIIKVFPATALGPQFIKDVRAPLPQIKLMPTGGVSLDNAGDWIRAGAVAVGAGSALLDGQAIADGRYEVIAANARRIVASVAAARQ